MGQVVARSREVLDRTGPLRMAFYTSGQLFLEDYYTLGCWPEGHNIPETHTVLWARILDRLDGPQAPRLVVVDPRRTRIAATAQVHLAIRPGTNVALLNGIQHELLQRGSIDEAFVAAHTVGLERLERVVAEYPPHVDASICDIPAAQKHPRDRSERRLRRNA